MLYISGLIAQRFTSRAIYFRDHSTQVYITCHIVKRSLHTGLHHVPYISEITSEIITHRFTSCDMCFRDHCTQVYITCQMPRRSLHTAFIFTLSQFHTKFDVARFEVLTAVLLKNPVLSSVTLCIVPEVSVDLSVVIFVIRLFKI